ncbi:MAG: YybS family protein [Alphaproteobacteria bacterium]|nr:YybS family protein [Alphaproteobacteria bacterium]
MPSQVRHGLIPGALSAFLYLLLPLSGGIGLLPGLVAPMPVIYAALAGGRVNGMVAAGFGTVVALAVETGFGLGYLLSAGLPGLVAGLALTWQRPDENGQPVYRGVDGLVVTGTLYALVCLIGSFAYLSGGVGMEATLREVFAETFEALPPEFGADVRSEMLDIIVGITPGAPLAVLGATLVVNGLWAARIAAKRGLLQRPPLNFAALRMPDWAFVAFAAAFVIAQISDGDIGFMAGQAGMVLAMPFLLVGLSVVHALTAGRPGRGIMLGFTYGLLILGIWPAIVTVVGLVDHVFGLKARFGAQRSGKDEE